MLNAPAAGNTRKNASKREGGGGGRGEGDDVEGAQCCALCPVSNVFGGGPYDMLTRAVLSGRNRGDRLMGVAVELRGGGGA